MIWSKQKEMQTFLVFGKRKALPEVLDEGVVGSLWSPPAGGTGVAGTETGAGVAGVWLLFSSADERPSPALLVLLLNLLLRLAGVPIFFFLLKQCNANFMLELKIYFSVYPFNMAGCTGGNFEHSPSAKFCLVFYLWFNRDHFLLLFL